MSPRVRLPLAAPVLATLALALPVAALAQNPSPALPQQQGNFPALSPAPTQRSVPPGPDAAATSSTQAKEPTVSPLAAPAKTPDAPSPQVTAVSNNGTLPARDSASGLLPKTLGFLGPYHAPVVPPLFAGDGTRLQSLIRDSKLYLSLEDAIALALENNLDVETERYNLVLGATDEVRAKGGGTLRGIDYTVNETPVGVGGPGSPLLNAATANSNPTTPTVTDLTSLNSTTQASKSLSQSTTGFAYSAGANLPLFDPQFIATGGWLRRQNTVTLTSTTGTTSTASTTQPGSLDYTALNIAYMQGFSTGGQLTAIGNNDSSVIYGSTSNWDPFSRPSTSVTFTQPLLRGAGTGVNRRFIRIAQTNRKISRLVFEQQVMDTIYGVSRLYFDLASLGENVLVKQESLRAATKLREDDEAQEQLGTLAPIELTRVRALESSSRFDLVQAQGLYKQQEIILRDQLLRTASPVFQQQFDSIVPTDHIHVPDADDDLDVPSMVAASIARRPDYAQAQLQVDAGRLALKGSHSAALPQLNLYGNVETRGSSEQTYDVLGSAGTGIPTTPTSLATGGLRVATIYQAGVQLTLPLRNRVAESDAARDEIQLRQVQAHVEKLNAQVREQIETSVVALDTARAAYQAATSSRQYQEQLLDAEKDKLSVGQSTDLAVLQNEAYLAQAKSTEIAARSNWMKARIELDHALGDLLDKNHITLDDAIRGQLPR
ncbi:TolC family protein [Granulicella cerasi]|uniref:TolC family protein n=1 Tax=Granulicella cerasi TaxID=741063 RepID=A0ABW1Z8L4_9BACT|nr:TolC family protein [Granulicella cerasi]